MPKTLSILGIMSGTSLDQVDFALCQVSESGIKLLKFWHAPFPANLRRRLDEAARGLSLSHELAQLHHDMGRFYARHALTSPRARLDLAGLHGQTIFHRPHPRHPATLQLGEPAYLSEALQVPVINNFRAADLAAGGEGAPLATLFHQFVFGEKGWHVCVQNLGGIGNVTSINWRIAAAPKIKAFDTGPANMLIDLAMRHFTLNKFRYDRDGLWARRGLISETLLDRWLKHPFIAKRPPKSTGRELFGESFLRAALQQMECCALAPHDLIATLTEFTARSIRANYQLHLGTKPDRIILAGGGVANPVLRKSIEQQILSAFPQTEVRSCEELGWPAQAVEPAAFALLAAWRVWGKAGNFPATTGALHPVLLGQISETGASSFLSTNQRRPAH
jgi:anhydro-N-acetylmuramic acid kinase